MNLPEQMYADLQAQLPALQEALATGTTYATELGGRIIDYDIAMNSLWILLISLFIYPAFRLTKGLWKLAKEDSSEDLFFIALFIWVPFLCALPLVGNIARGIFVPEWRLIEILSKLI
jgi:hypothetical protein